ncbi:MAG: hypothetical protein IPM82_25025 [Saprospiraceae bacterium]|nr:hypothetical protein [Saprospiraceae bacterium]
MWMLRGRQVILEQMLPACKTSQPKPDAGNVNGDPEKTTSQFLVNAGIPVGENAEVYANAAYVYKKVNSFANYRTPYWRPASETPGVEFRQFAQKPKKVTLGYAPTFEGDLTDYNGTFGFRSEKTAGTLT